MEDTFRYHFDDAGFTCVPGMLARDECRSLIRRLRSENVRGEWRKDKAAWSAAFVQIGADARIVDRLAELIGEDVMLWGATLVTRPPGMVHPWHTDVETSDPNGTTVSVWIGLENSNARSSLSVVSRSHRFATIVQEHAHHEGKRRDDLTAEDVTRWAAEADPRSRVEALSLQDGDALFFHGRLWHGSHNTSSKTRTALLLQYATPETPILIPQESGHEWPLRFMKSPRPVCVMVRGTDVSGANRIVSVPSADRKASWIRQLDLPLSESAEDGWQGYPIFRGSTLAMSALSCHASVLSAGRMPHDPHVHDDEEILLMLSGEAELVLVDREGRTSRHQARRGHVAYYPRGQRHTIDNRGSEPATYLMFKWKGATRPSRDRTLETILTTSSDHAPDDAKQALFAAARVFEGPTQYLRKLHCHVTVLQPDGGYDEHTDAYDVAILILDGVVETLGRRVGPDGVIFYDAGEPHGMKNVGEGPAVYVVFEFHGVATPPEAPSWHDGTVWRAARKLGRRMRRKLRRLTASASPRAARSTS